MAILFMTLVTHVQQGFIISTQAAISGQLQRLQIGIYVFSILAILGFVVPYFFLFTSWFVGINDVHKSRNYQYFMAVFLTVSVVLILIAAGLIIAYYSYSFSLWIPN